MQRKSRIALVGPWKWSVGGVTTFMANLAESHLRESYEFLCFNTARPPKRYVADNYGYGAIWKGGIGRAALSATVTLLHLIAYPIWLAVRKPNVVQVQASDFQAFWEAGLYVLVSKAMGVAVVERIGGAFDNFYLASSPKARRLIRRFLNWPDRLIVQSEYWRKFVAELGRTEGVCVLPNWVRDMPSCPAERPTSKVPVCFFSAGSDAVRKGVDDVLAAATTLKSEETGLLLLIVAAPPEIERRVITAGLGGIVRTTGYLNRSEMHEALKSADIFLLPSRAEGFPNALLEAMAIGLAPVVTPVGSIPEIVADGGALTIPVGDHGALATAILRLAGDAELRATIGASARRTVSAYYTEAAVLPDVDRLWQALLRRRQ